jgi:chemotaxis protein CheD
MAKEIIVVVGTYIVAKNPTTLTCIGLGSCLAVVLHDRNQRVGGLTHSMLPRYDEGKDKLNPGKYVDTSIYLMVDELLQMGSTKRALKAKIIGGAQMFNFQNSDILDVGNRNIRAAKETLKAEGIPIVAQEVGGNKGRTISFNIKTGKIEIRINNKPNKTI